VDTILKWLYDTFIFVVFETYKLMIRIKQFFAGTD
jgi:hypothetical protein